MTAITNGIALHGGFLPYSATFLMFVEYARNAVRMTNAPFNHVGDFNDVAAKNRYAELRRQGRTEEDAMALLRRSARDNARTPMQWDSGENGGFSHAF